MNINRFNYEEYFLLYVDNELSAVERAQVDEFVQQHPDLREELNMLLQSVIRPDKKISFPNKADLMRNSAPANPVNESNYEEYFLLYGDDELNNEEKDLVEQFVYKHPQYQSEFELLQSIRLSPDNSVVFPDKQSLYRREKSERVVILMRFWKVAAAAVLVLFIGGAAWYYNSGSNSTDPNTVAGAGKTNNPTTNTDTASPDKIIAPIIENIQPQQNLASAGDKPTEKISVKENAQAKYTEKLQPAVKEEIYIAQTDSKINSSKPSNILDGSAVTHTEPIVAKVEPATTLTTSSPDQEISFEKLGVNDPKPINATYASNTEDGQIEVLNTTVSNKSKMRGFFRKVGRVVGKATNIETSEEKEDKKGIRIASFQIALK